MDEYEKIARHVAAIQSWAVDVADMIDCSNSATRRIIGANLINDMCKTISALFEDK